MGMDKVDMERVLSVREQLLRKSVTVGDLAAIALTRGWAKEIQLWAIPNRLEIAGKFDFDPTRDVRGYWFVKKKRTMRTITLPLVSEGYWNSGYSYVSVGPEKIEVVIRGEPWVSRTNICGIIERMGGDKHVVVHVVGSLRSMFGHVYTAFRCSEWILPLSVEMLFDRFSFDKRGINNDITGQPVEFWDVFVREGVVVKVLVNASCEEYAEAVKKLFKADVRCERH
jgi:hypothetical protein